VREGISLKVIYDSRQIGKEKLFTNVENYFGGPLST
jgi:hypothetical protein